VNNDVCESKALTGSVTGTVLDVLKCPHKEKQDVNFQQVPQKINVYAVNLFDRNRLPESAGLAST
jgi:hypothetical protein